MCNLFENTFKFPNDQNAMHLPKPHQHGWITSKGSNQRPIALPIKHNKCIVL